MYLRENECFLIPNRHCSLTPFVSRVSWLQPVIEDIEGILGTTVENAEEQEKESEEGRGET